MQNNAPSHHRRRPSSTEAVTGAGNSTPDINDSLCSADSRQSTSTMEITSGDSPANGTEQNQQDKNMDENSSTAKNGIIRQISLRLRLSSLARRPSARPERIILSPAARALKGLKFVVNDADWKGAEKWFDKMTAGTEDGLLPREQLPECINAMQMESNKKMDKESKEFTGILFEAVARRQNVIGKFITKEQFKELWDQVVDPGFDNRLQTFFDMVDKDGNGKIVEDEVKEIISLSASANHLSNIQNRAGECARLIMEELDPKGRGYIMIENLERVLLQPTPTCSAAASAEVRRKLSKTWSAKLKPTQEHFVKRSFQYIYYHMVDYWRRVWMLALWIGAMAGLYAYKYVQYKNRAAFTVMGHCLCVAKGAAETLKLNMGLMLLMMCRKTITWLRNNTRLGTAIPFDDNINFHQVIAIAIIIGTTIHTVAHMTCDFPRILHASPEKFKPMIRFFKHQPISYWQMVKGCEGLTGIAMVLIMLVTFPLASPWLRRNELRNLPKCLKRLTGFNAFWYSHHLFVVLYILLIIHGWKLYLGISWYSKTTWMYLAIPILLYTGERLIRAFRSNAEPVQILKPSVHPGNVLALKMSKPEGFTYKSGQYIFVKCADVSPFEWHPFSLTSAPQDDHISVHIRALGDWTRQIKVVFEACQASSMEKSELLLQETVRYPRVWIDGPYGAPTQDYKDYEIVLLVGLGIGATPMISVVKDIAINIQEKKRREEAKQKELEEGRIISGSSNGRDNDFNVKKAYLYWVTREQGSFDWFHDVMDEVSGMNCNDVVEIHNYCSSMYEEGDVRSALITMLQAINHMKNGVDIVSGTKVKSHFGKPNWKDVFKTIALNHLNKTIGVFYCGNPSLVKKLRHLSSDYSHKIGTRFEFHKENF